MLCEKCGKQMKVENNPKYKIPNTESETHLVYICDCNREGTD